MEQYKQSENQGLSETDENNQLSDEEGSYGEPQNSTEEPNYGMNEGCHEHVDTSIPRIGMKSSQRSESMNAFFDGFVHCTTPLSEFVDQYDAAIEDRRSKEEKEDFTCMTTKPNFGEMYPIEVHAGQVYTRSVFKKFMEELKLLFHCRHKKVKGDGENLTTK